MKTDVDQKGYSLNRLVREEKERTKKGKKSKKGAEAERDEEPEAPGFAVRILSVFPDLSSGLEPFSLCHSCWSNDLSGLGLTMRALQVNVADPRFGKLFERADFAIDPTDPKFKRTKGMSDLLEERRKRHEHRLKAQDEEAPAAAKPATKSGELADDLQQLVASVRACLAVFVLWGWWSVDCGATFCVDV